MRADPRAPPGDSPRAAGDDERQPPADLTAADANGKPVRRAPAGGVGKLRRILLGDDPGHATLVKGSLAWSAVHLIWALSYWSAADAGTMGRGAMQFLVATNLVGMFAFFAAVRSGRTTHLRNPSLVLPQIIWATLSAGAGYALAPSLRPAALQAMCLIQITGYFGLRPRELLAAGGTAIGVVALDFAIAGASGLPDFDVRQEAYPSLLSVIVLVSIIAITVDHSLRRRRVHRQKRTLDDAVEQLRGLVVRDTLTGLFNRRHMQELLREEQTRARATGRSFAVALLDLDHFKRINDVHGHGIGDEVLRRFADMAGLAMRQSDTVARWGGEEFIVLMPETAVADDACSPLDRLREEIAGQDPASLLVRLGVTFSAGIAFHRPNEAIEQVVACADRALYAAKAAGRNRSLIDLLPIEASGAPLRDDADDERAVTAGG